MRKVKLEMEDLVAKKEAYVATLDILNLESDNSTNVDSRKTKNKQTEEAVHLNKKLSCIGTKISSVMNEMNQLVVS